MQNSFCKTSHLLLVICKKEKKRLTFNFCRVKQSNIDVTVCTPSSMFFMLVHLPLFDEFHVQPCLLLLLGAVACRTTTNAGLPPAQSTGILEEVNAMTGPCVAEFIDP